MKSNYLNKRVNYVIYFDYYVTIKIFNIWTFVLM